MNKLPANWKEVKLKDALNDYIRGPFGSALKRNELLNKGIAVYEQQHAIYNTRNFRYFIDKNKYEQLKRFTVFENDLIISCSGTLGKVSIIKENDTFGIISQALLLLRPNINIVYPKYLYYYFFSNIGYNALLSRSTGSVQINTFPLIDIEETAKYRQVIDDEFLENEIMWRRKDSAEAFAILSFLYPNLDYKNNDFNKDHLHAESLYKKYKELGEAKKLKDTNYNYYDFYAYDSLPNLQMLDANENKAKQDKPLEQWIKESCKNKSDRKEFLKRHLIPDVDLSLENFDNFYEERKKLLMDELKKILN